MLLRIWYNKLERKQFEEIVNIVKILHKAMKNLIEIIFTTSPLLALSTHGWASKFRHRVFLVRVSGFLFLLSILTILIDLLQDLHRAWQ